MQIAIYEYLTGGGLTNQDLAAAPASLLREGTAMVSALSADFAAVPRVEVTVLRDGRLTELAIPGCRIVEVNAGATEAAALAQCAAAADWTVVIAPEFNGCLLDRCRLVEAAGGRLLGPGPRLVELSADKQATCEFLGQRHVPVPPGRALAPGESLPADFPYPAVLKPRFGAGSQDMRLVERASGLAADATSSWRLERFCPGLAASVAWLCGPGQRLPLAPCRQNLSNDGRFTYLGGSLPLPAELARRAVELTGRAVAALPDPLGYIGLDLVLGDRSSGRDDYVIEVNPRLTTSYVGLRAAAEQNLAAAMLAIAEGRTPRLGFSMRQIEFTLDGQLVQYG